MATDMGALARQAVRAGWRLVNPGSIKGKILTVFSAAFLSIMALSALNLWNIGTLKERLLLSERYDDLLNDILEARRFEKNFFIYGDRQSLQESKEYLDRIDALAAGLSPDLTRLVGRESFTAFVGKLADYRATMERLGAGNGNSPDRLRSLGKQLTGEADRFREIKRARIHAAILRISALPFAFLLIFLALMLPVVLLISRGLLRPLNVITGTTRAVGRGDFSPIHYDGVRLEEISGLIEAFNRMARELEIHQEDLIQARKIAAIGTFTAGIAHELNNPINNIVLTADSLKEELEGTTEAENMEMLADILTQAERAAGIVKNLLDFSRTEKPVFSELAPERIVASSVDLVKNQFKTVGMQFETSIVPGLPPICGNLANLQQVFTNLLLNAIQASPQGETILLRVEHADRPGFLSFAVQDHGKGIPEEIQHKIFEPFFTTKEVGKGTGLGLAVSYSIVKRHGGTLAVHSEPGCGATFTVLLPHVARNSCNDLPWGSV
ncbi:MAG: HAMP domain-containing histidine kinase [Desulfobulbus sp.]|jgi:signal transduction histidine kinase|uniref:sensor histidine kinase n=1 Tax=Desulfobulbus sp. TaxID=895 RepID=UPI00285116AF|nr:HAMP domain-containing sensor histidine kinase [Desulfobulbus sp.]MDR2550156.1 HAMP domain-containing histidine kinase [Desulfobulbus sp.]